MNYRPNADQIAAVLHLKKRGAGYRGACPVHGGSSFEVRDKNGTTLFHCWAGCDQGAVLRSLQDRGLWRKADETSRKPPSNPRPDADRIAWAEAFVLIAAQQLRDGKPFSGSDLAMLPSAMRVVRDFSRPAGQSASEGKPSVARQALPELQPLLDAVSVCSTAESYIRNDLPVPSRVSERHIQALRLIAGNQKPSSPLPQEAIDDINNFLRKW